MSSINKKVSIGIFSLVLGLSGCASNQKAPPIEQGSPVFGASGNIVNMDQQWSVETQQSFYFTSQGSRILPYSWYLNLEQSTTTALFRDNAHMQSLRYLPAEKSPWNPDGLAVGFAKDVDSKTGEEWMGFNCAACHTAEVRYRGRGIRIDGGPTLADFESFNQSLVEAMNETYRSNNKFSRFANGVLGKKHSANAAEELRNNLLQQTEVLATRNMVNHPDPDQPHYGYGRVDAIGAIFNQILSKFNDMPNNGHASDAPVSYPFLWGTHQSDVVQWTGFAPNGPASVGTLIRNGGEVLGVYGQLDIPERKSKIRYPSSLAIKNLGELEKWVAELRSPIWPSEYFPAIDPITAAKGQLHYDNYCVSCHQVMPRADQGQDYKAVLTPVLEVRTDPQEIINMLKTRPAGKFAGRKEFVIAGDKIPAQTTGLFPLVNSVIGALLKHPWQTIEAAFIENEKALRNKNNGLVQSTASTPEDDSEHADAAADDADSVGVPPSLVNHLKKYQQQFNTLAQSVAEDSPLTSSAAVYKARPLTGIWATAPYLHNGSVPNLYELLLPEEKRSKVFYLGNREFDPKNVGYVSTPSVLDRKMFKFDTTLTGNSNSGHEYGTKQLNNVQRMELLEYLKTL
ncbi:di-heme-cytochrome C peroxidase [Motiliproteus sp. MSK22-1]|uniref:di-heme-cytochrome C peroxidase n=1 Tax=Motiliproteus sp. MSK22-1 TaxID=1897630 RepID=UPI0009FB29AD|nr:di-heme-cytochrome C peroxidase [Motiliproteus sp. MSK22-1]